MAAYLAGEEVYITGQAHQNRWRNEHVNEHWHKGVVITGMVTTSIGLNVADFLGEYQSVYTA